MKQSSNKSESGRSLERPDLLPAPLRMSKRDLLLLSIFFIVAHIIFWILGVRFDARTLHSAWQFLDPELLRHHLLESCVYLHSQPPLFNLFLGAVLKLFPGNELAAFHSFYLLCGFLLYGTLFVLQIKLGISRRLSLTSSTLFLLSPSFILYEHWLFYSFPIALLLALSAFFFHEVLETRKPLAGLGFFFILFLLAGSRSMFHFVYYCALACLLFFALRYKRKQVLLWALIPFVGVLLLYAKNFYIFETFSTSTWLGMNFWSSTVENVPLPLRQSLVEEGKLSELALIDRFSPLERYPESFQNSEKFRSIPALQNIEKSTGAYNFNHPAYIGISAQYFQDDLYVLRNLPKYFLTGLARSWFYYFKTSSDHDPLRKNLEHLSGFAVLYDSLFYGKLPFNLSGSAFLSRKLGRSLAEGHHLYLFLLLGLPLLVLHALTLVLRGSHPTRLTDVQRLTTFYLCVNIAYVACIANLFEVGENNRFRFITEPFYLILLGLSLQYCVFPWFAGRFSKR